MKQEERLRKWDELIRQKQYPGIQNFNELVQRGEQTAKRTLEKDIQLLKTVLGKKYPNEKTTLKFSREKGE